MEAQEDYQAQIFKGKRTKRPRPPSPGFHMVSSSSSTTPDYSGGASPTTSASTEEEDQDMAKCLILLAQGRGSSMAVREKAAESLYVYQCKTCDRCFPSFQALGGHRASHKKPKNNMIVNYAVEHDDQFRNSGTILSLQIAGGPPPASFTAGNMKAKVHECSICRAEFSSGQALGGHMRRHRAVTAVSGGTTSLGGPQLKKERTVLELDLNLPAPEEERHRTVTVFSTSPLVDCFY